MLLTHIAVGSVLRSAVRLGCLAINCGRRRLHLVPGPLLLCAQVPGLARLQGMQTARRHRDSHADHRAAGLRGGADGGAGTARAGGALLWAGGSCTARMQPQSSCSANLAKSVWKL